MVTEVRDPRSDFRRSDLDLVMTESTMQHAVVTAVEKGPSRADLSLVATGITSVDGRLHATNISSLRELFEHGDRVDAMLMAVGAACALGVGAALPVFIIVFADLLSAVAGSGDSFAGGNSQFTGPGGSLEYGCAALLLYFCYCTAPPPSLGPRTLLAHAHTLHTRPDGPRA